MIPQEAPPGTPLYVHLPHCVSKCTYCDFYSVVAEGQDLEGTLERLLVEARRRAPREPCTVFLGGGTPSLHGEEAIGRFLDELHAITGFRDSASEVTAECNPESLDRSKADALLGGGVDRLSVGIQSLDPRILTLFGRAHDADQGLAALAAAREAGCRRLSLDVIYGAPGQTAEAWERELLELLASGPEHVSAYGLMYEEGTQMTRWRASGEVEPLDEVTDLALFEATRRLLAEAGMEAYEVSNFSLSGEQCAHNVNYWRNGPYVGIGPSAVSKIGFTRFGNPRSIQEWAADVDAGRDAAAWSETPEPASRLGETWWLGLRLREGVAPDRAREAAGWAPAPGRGDPAETLAAELAAEGWLEAVGGAWRLTEAALPLADAVAKRFLRATAADATA